MCEEGSVGLVNFISFCDRGLGSQSDSRFHFLKRDVVVFDLTSAVTELGWRQDIGWITIVFWVL